MQNLSDVQVKNCKISSNTNTAVDAMRTKMDAACLEQRPTNVLKAETHGNSLVTRAKGSIGETGQQHHNDDVWQVNNNNNNFVKIHKHDEKQPIDASENNKGNSWSNPCQSCEAAGAGGGGVGSLSVGGDGKKARQQQSEQKSVMMIQKAVTQRDTKIEDEGGGVSLSRCTLTNGTNGTLSSYDFHTQNNCLFKESQKSGLGDVAHATSKFECEGATAMVNPLSPSYLNAGVDCAGRSFHSNRTSRNNSTENLSYSSDNYFPEELIFLEEHDDDPDIEADDVSLNSDDCVYAYRGDGAEIDLLLNRCDRRDGAFDGPVDDETDFLEMDFEPDPSSEADLANYGVRCDDADRFSDIQSRDTTTNLENFLKQRDSGQITGRHSASIGSSGAYNIGGRRNACYPIEEPPKPQHRHFSSPTDHLPLASGSGGLQAQSLLSKNFARISLHLDQIRCSPEPPFTKDLSFERLHVQSSSVENSVVERKEIVDTTSHSLPNNLHPNFGHNTKTSDDYQRRASPSKATGAKPKRLSTAFSTSSSNSSKNSSKSRASLRSVVAPSAFFASASFDERSVSCTEFRSEQTSDDNLLAVAAVIGCNPDPNPNPSSDNAEESCLDCLEKEFLASTIGKSAGSHSKCRKHINSSSDIKRYARFQQTRCRSGSPTFFNEIPIDYFSLGANNHLDGRNQSELQLKTRHLGASYKLDYELKSRTDSDLGITTSPILPAALTHFSDISIAEHSNFIKANENLLRHHYQGGSGNFTAHDEQSQQQLQTGGFSQKCDKNQRSATAVTAAATITTANKCDNSNISKLSNKLLLPSSKMSFVTLPTNNLRQETLVQALDKLNISYNLELIKAYFDNCNSTNGYQLKTFEQFLGLTKESEDVEDYGNAGGDSSCAAGGSSCGAGDSSNNAGDSSNAAGDTSNAAGASGNAGGARSSSSDSPQKMFNNFKDFLLFESKKNCDYPKIQRLIEVATQKSSEETQQQQQKVHIKFEEDYDVKKPELVSIAVADLLQQFKINNDLRPLKTLDKRFADMNVLGKIANIVRQAQMPHNSQRRSSNDFLMIPQYYPSGQLKIMKVSSNP